MGLYDDLLPQAQKPAATGLYDDLVPQSRAPIAPGNAMAAQPPVDNSPHGLVSQAFNAVAGEVNRGIDQEQAAFSAAPVQHSADIARSIPGGAVSGGGSALQGLAELNDVAARGITRGLEAIPVVGPSIGEAMRTPLPWYLTPSGIAREAGEGFEQLGDLISPPEERQTVLTHVGEAGGQIVGAAATGPVGATAQFVGMGADQMADRSRELGQHGTVQGDAATVGGAAITGLADKLGLDFLLNRVPPAIKNKIMQRMVDVGLGAGIEGGQEVAENTAQNAVSQAFLDDDTALSEGNAGSAVVGGGTGAVTRFILGMLGVKGAGAGNVDPEIAAEIEAAAADDSEGGAALRSILEQGGVTSEQQAAMSPEFEQRAEQTLQRRRAQDAERAQLAPNTDMVQRTADQEAVAAGDVDPGAISQAFREPLPETIQVSPYGQGQAQTQAETGINAGMADAGRVRSDIDRDAEAAFKLAQRQRERSQQAPTPHDTQPAPRPQGQAQQPVHLDEGFPVEILDRRVVGKGNRSYEEATVRRYDPRTGQPEAGAEEYTVPVSRLKTKNYATDPRQSQDFTDRAEGPITPEQPRRPNEGVTREREQTFRTTAPDPNQDFPAAGAGRSPLPEQPAGPMPGPQRPSNEEEVLREFAERQRAEQEGKRERAKASTNDYAGKEWAKKFNNKSAPPDQDGRFGVDDAGHVASDKGGPMRFADQKQAAKWILNVGHKHSTDQIFEVANHPSGQGFTVRERGRTEGPGPKPGGNGQPGQDAASGPQKAPGAPLRLTAPKTAAQVKAELEAEQETDDDADMEELAEEADAEPEVKRTGKPKVRRANNGEIVTDDAPERPMDILQFLAQRGGIKDELAEKYNNTAAGRANKQRGELEFLYVNRPAKAARPARKAGKGKKFRPARPATAARRASMGVRIGRTFHTIINSRRGLSLDYAREAAVEAGYLPPDADINDLLTLMEDQASGKDSFAAHAGAESDADAAAAWRQYKDQQAVRPEEDLPEQDEAAFDIDPDEMDRQRVMRELDDLGEEIDPNASLDELSAQLDHRLSMMDGGADAGGDAGNSAGEDQAEPRESDQDNRDAGDGASDAGANAEGSSSAGRPGGGAAPEASTVKTERTDQGEQAIMPGMERSAKQAQSARDNAHHGRKGTDAPQKDADEGLFAKPEDKRQTEIKLTAGVDPTMIWNLLGGPAARALFGSKAELKNSAADIAALARGVKGTNPLRAIAAALRSVFRSSDGAMRGVASKFKSATLDRVINQLAVPGGELSAAGRTYEEELISRSNSRRARIDAIFKPLSTLKDNSKAGRARAMTIIANKVRTGRFGDGTLDKVARDVAAFLKEELKYMRDAGVEVGEVKGGYLPREIDRVAVVKNQAKFLAAATRLYQSEAGMSRKDAAEAAGRWMSNIMHGGEGSPHHDGGGAPSFVKERVFSKRAEKMLDGFLHDDVESILDTYTYRAAKRAAVARRFGDGWSEWADIEEAIRKEGAAEAISDLREHAAVVTGTANSKMSSGVRTFSSLLRMWTTLSLLEKATLSSLGEAFMTAARTGNVFDGLRSAGIVAKEVAYALRGKKSELKAFSEDIGAIAGSYQHAVMAGTGIDHNDILGDTQRKVLGAYFHRTGLEAFTNATIAANVQMGGVFLRRLAHDIAGKGSTNKSSRLYLRELGIPDDKMDAFAKAVVKLGDSFPTVDNMPGELGDMARTALIRFQRQVVQQPTAAARPRWASHPVGAVAFQLGGWGYSFARNITLPGLKKAALAVTEKDLAVADRARLLAALLPGMVLVSAVQYGVGELRDLFEDEMSALVSPTGESQKRELSAEAKIERAVSRGGLLGALDPYIQTFAGITYGRDASALWSGPGLGRIAQGINTAIDYVGRNSERTNTAERKIATSLYDMVIEPTANFALAWLPQRAAASALTIGVIPALRDAFVNETAGTKDRKQARKDKSEPIRGILESVIGGK